MRKYEVEFMGEDKTDMYSLIMEGNDIEEVLKYAMTKKDKETDYIISITEIMK